MRAYRNFVFIVLMTMSACSSGEFFTPYEFTWKRDAGTDFPVATTKLVASEAYLLLSTTSAPFSYNLARLPVTCLSNPTQYQGLETIPQFPGSEFSPLSLTPLHWSPDGQWGLIVNGFNSKLLLVDAETGSLSTISVGADVISDRISWSSDNIAAFTVQHQDTYTSSIALFDAGKNSARELPIEFPGTVFPLGWINAHELALFQETYKIPPDPDQKREISGFSLVKLDTRELIQESIANLPLVGNSSLTLSPDGNAFAAINEEGILEVYSTNWVLQRSLGVYINPAWSPDSLQLAAVAHDDAGFSVVVLNPESGEPKSLMQLVSQPEIAWIPNSSDLLISYLTLERQGMDTYQFLIVSSASGEIQELDLEKIIDEQQIILNISFNPTYNP